MGTLNPRGQRAQFGADEVSAHRRLADVLEEAPDWDAEYAADLEDLLLLIQQRWGRA